MKSYKVFIEQEDGILRSIFHLFNFYKGENNYKKDTRGFISWSKKEEAERYRETLTAIHFYKIIIKEIRIEEKDIIRKCKERLYTKKSQEILKIKNPYGTAIYSEKIFIF